MNFSSGLISGFAGAILFTPLDCVKTRIQKQSGLSWVQAFKRVKKEGGVPALFNGGLARGILVGMLFGAAQVNIILRVKNYTGASNKAKLERPSLALLRCKSKV